MIGAYVETALAERFKAWARQSAGGASSALRRLVLAAVDGKEAPPPAGAGRGIQIGVRLKKSEHAALVEAASARGTSPANWLRSLALVHLNRRPQWNQVELETMREIGNELRRIGNNLNQIARALNVAAHTGQYAPYQGTEAREAAELIRLELRGLIGMMTGNFDYWGLPDPERVAAAQKHCAAQAGQPKGEEFAPCKSAPHRQPSC
jgi:uncharacterized protein YukE